MPALDFSIVDAHVHQWDPNTTPRATSIVARLLGRFPQTHLRVGRAVFPKSARAFVGVPDGLLLPYMPEDHARDCAAFAVDTVVHVEAGWMARGLLGPVGETRWVDGLDFASHGKRLGAIVAHADLRDKRIDELLAAHVQASNKVRGVRQMASRHPDRSIMAFANVPSLYVDTAFLRGFERLQAQRLRFDAWVYSNQLADVAALAQRFPEAPIVLDHLGTPVAAGGPVGNVGKTEQERERIRESWRADLARVAEHKNVFAKLSGVAMPIVGFGFHTRPEPPSVEELTDAIGPYIRHALDLFGVERCFFASNFPMDKVSAPLDRIFSSYLRLAEERGPTAKRALLRDNALRFYGV